jgi:hypothetical protein
MKQLLVIFSLLTLTACSTPVPIKPKFPGIPQELITSCPDLNTIDPNTTKLSDVILVVTENYSNYQECKIKVDGWLDWYKTQKSIYESVK